MRLLRRAEARLRYARNLRGFLRDKLTPEQAYIEIRRRLAGRQQSFLDVLERGVYARPSSPYAQLLQHAGVSQDDVRRLVQQTGVEGTLERLYDAGVYVTTEELKGRTPIKRGALEISTQPSDFANPFMTERPMTLRSSGSTGAPSRTNVGFSNAFDDSLCLAASLDAHGLRDRPGATLVVSGLANLWALWFAKLGQPLERHFDVMAPRAWHDRQSRETIVVKLAVYGLQLALRRRLLRPDFSTDNQIVQAAEWLAQQRAQGTPALLRTFCSPAVRLCLIARERGLDISGSVMRVSGEPFTPGKAAVLASAGVRPIVVYAANETGEIADSCDTPTELDDVHFFSDRAAVIQRQKQVAPGTSVGALVLSSIVTSGRRLLLNAESGDYATVEQRDCGCLLGEIGLTTHLSNIRSHEKLTSEGVTFIGSALHDLVEQVLPARFGGSSADYQLVEEEVEGLPKVSIVVDPSVGPIDESALIASVVDELRQPLDNTHLWTKMWLEENTLRIVRREPYKTVTAKVLPLHILRPAD